MDFITYAVVPDLSWIGPVLAISLFSFCVSLFCDYSRWGQSVIVLSILGMLTSAVVPIVVDAATAEDRAVWRHAVVAEAAEVYGVALTESDVFNLGFPHTEPTADYQAFGTIEHTGPVGDSFESRDITLIWSDGRLLLAESVSGEQFTPLEAEGR